MSPRKLASKFVRILGMAGLVLSASSAGIASDKAHPSLPITSPIKSVEGAEQGSSQHLPTKVSASMSATVLRHDGDQITCGLPVNVLKLKLLNRTDSLKLHYIGLGRDKWSRNDHDLEQQTGAKIIMRTTDQLENYPLAKEAFIRAAAEWESIIKNPITIVLDVDFGPKRFGETYPPNVLASTDPQLVLFQEIYKTLRSALIESAETAEEITHYERLPIEEIMTDVGPSTNIRAPSSVFRALGIIELHADPETEEAEFGPPPSIGFNSKFDWDFNPDDGIDLGKQDFVGSAIHEIGHALGFVSSVGLQELYPQYPTTLSTWDLNRLIPGAGADFTHAPRVLSSGGDQVHYSEQDELALSTGRPDGSGGDGRQASHWKDDSYTLDYIGVMDPTQTSGHRSEITENDILALDLMGYSVAGKSTGVLSPVSPVGDTTETTPRFSWTAMPGADWYVVVVTNDQGSISLFNYVTSGVAGCGTGSGECAIEPNRLLSMSRTYRWWVGALGADGAPLGASDAVTFRIN
jgi:hypothetical protein